MIGVSLKSPGVIKQASARCRGANLVSDNHTVNRRTNGDGDANVSQLLLQGQSQ